MKLGRPKYDEIRQMSSKTYVLDLPDPIRAYLKSIGHFHSTVGTTVVWVRYGKSHKRGGPYPVKVGPTRESVCP